MFDDIGHSAWSSFHFSTPCRSPVKWTGTCLYLIYIPSKVIWQCRDLVSLSKQSSRSHFLVKDGTVMSFPAVPMASDIVLQSWSWSGQMTAHVVQNERESTLLIAGTDGRVTTIDLRRGNLHGKVYCDPYISSLEWSTDGRKVAFVAEKFRGTPDTFYSSTSGPENEHEERGEKNLYVDDWGEQMRGQHQGVVVIVDVVSEERFVIPLPDGATPGQLIWKPGSDDVIGVAYPSDAYKIGIAYCSDRNSFLFCVDHKGKYEELTPRGQHVKSPRFSPSGGKLVFLQSTIYGDRAPTAQLVLMTWATRKVEVLVDYVNSSQAIKDNKFFVGVCGKSILPHRCFDEGEKLVLFSAFNLSNQVIYSVNIETKLVAELTDPRKFSLPLDLMGNRLLLLQSTVTEPDRVFISELLPETETLGRLHPVSGRRQVEEIPEDWFHLWRFRSPTKGKDGRDIEPSVLYIGPKGEEQDPTSSRTEHGKRPLICWPHGGPHSLIGNRFSPMISFFVGTGYSVVLPNYRGSVGHGNDFLSESLGQCGKADVDDCNEALEECFRKFGNILDRSKIFLIGLSHGGFIALHLAARFPNKFRALASINGATDIYIMATVSDIPEWAFLEYGLPFSLGRSIDHEAMTRMHESSPVTFVDQIKTPSIFLLGKEDVRVPASQGLNMHRLLLARNVPTRVYMYDDDHPLLKISSESDYLIQIAKWFKKYS